ncbi:MAG: UDP-N-acetylmuramoyl-L-alanine--D-glutamate ligase [Chloroflexota bacterium]
MKMRDWNERRVVIVGAARQGTSLARYLSEKGAQVTLTDQKTWEEMEKVREGLNDIDLEWVLGGHPLTLLDDADVLALSGGVPLTIHLVEEAQRRGIPLTNDSQIFLDQAPCPVIGVTGSAGKTTTTVLLGRMIEEQMGPERVWVGGNIGNPLIDVVDEMLAEDYAVLELSSFQLELMTTAPEVAAILNITPNHLDRHGTMEAYTAAKSRIVAYQTRDDIAVLNRDDPGSWDLKEMVPGELISFGLHRPPKEAVGTYLKQGMIALWEEGSSVDLFPAGEVHLRGEHNLANVLAACALAHAVGVEPRAMAAGVEGFRGVEHRLEYVRNWGGAEWYNDSIATAPERAIAAMQSFSEPLVLLAGGRDKDLPWEGFARVVEEQVRHVILFGEAVDVIEGALQDVISGYRELPITRCGTLKEAVQAAAEVVQPGDVVLLSPGGTSFDEFKDFAERGEYFKQWVNKLN